MDPIELTREFIRIPSPTGNEKEYAIYVEERLEEVGWEVTRMPVEDERWNLFATPRESHRPEVVFCTHLDTVEPFVDRREDDDYLYGRGACDAKGVMAAMITAAAGLADEGIRNIGLLFTVGEEVDSAGAKQANLNPAKGVQYTIVGEPTENRLAVGQKGIYVVDVETKGRSAHSAYPDQGDSAVAKLLDILSHLRGTEFPVHEKLGRTTLNISRLKGGERHNVIPDSAGAGLMFRVSTSLGEIKTILEQAVDGQGEIHEINQCEPQEMVSVPGFEQDIVSFSTDIPFLSNWGRKLLMGPGSILDAHTLEEKVARSELQEAVRKYHDLARHLLS